MIVRDCVQARQERAFCRANYLSHGTLAMIDGMRTQLVTELKGRKLLRSLPDASSSARDVALIRCVLVRLRAAGLPGCSV